MKLKLNELKKLIRYRWSRRVLFAAVLGLVVVISVVVLIYLQNRSVSREAAQSPTNYGIDVAQLPYATQVEQDGRNTSVVKNQLVVRFTHDLSSTERDQLGRDLKAYSMKRISLNFWVIVFNGVVDIQAKIAQLKDNPLVAEVDYDDIYTVYGNIPPDDLQGTMWWASQINIEQGWQTVQTATGSTGDPLIKVGVVDQSIYDNHNDLAGKIVRLESGATGDHGTHVAGVIGAATDNSIGYAAMGYDVGVVGGGGCDVLGGCASSDIAAAVTLLIDSKVSGANDVRVINLSLGGGDQNSAIHDAIDEAWRAGILLVSASGNCGNPSYLPAGCLGEVDQKSYPASYDHVISVAATNSRGNRAAFSNYSDAGNPDKAQMVDVAAPGGDQSVAMGGQGSEEIVSTFAGGPDRYGGMRGTSQAASMVSAIAALCSSIDPSLTNQQLYDIIQNPNNSLGNSFTNYGLIQAERVLAECAGQPIVNAGGYCNSWFQTSAFSSSTNSTHPFPSYLANGYYYVHDKQTGKIHYAKVQGDSCLAGWQDSSVNLNDTAGRGYTALVVDGYGIGLRFGREEKMVTGANGDVVSIDQLEGQDGVLGNRYFWNSAILVELGGRKWAYQFGGYIMLHGPWQTKTYRAEASASNLWYWEEYGPDFDQGQPYKGAFYTPDGNRGWIYVADQNGNLRKTLVNSNGDLGGWGSAGPNFPGSGKGDYFVVNDQFWVIRGSKVYMGNIDPASGNIDVFSDAPPDLPDEQIDVDWRATDTEGPAYGVYNNTIYVTGKDRVYFLPLNGNCAARTCAESANNGSGNNGSLAGGTSACTVQEWLSAGPDVLVPPITCNAVWKGTPNPDFTPAPGDAPPTGVQYSCRQCGEVYLFPQPDWVSHSPTNQDNGQKDGTGKTGADRTYYHFDYERNTLVNVPPFSWGSGGGQAIAPTPWPTITGIPNVPTNVPCGWPNRREDSRIVTQVCSNGECPANGADNATTCWADRHNYPAIDVGLEFDVFATMDGTAYRCVDPSNGYGTYVLVTNGAYTTLNAHMSSLPTDQNDPSVTGCFSGSVGVKRWVVRRGDYIGTVGMTGETTGPHTHYEIRTPGGQVCPASYMDYSNPACAAGTRVTAAVDQGANWWQQLVLSLNPFILQNTAKDGGSYYDFILEGSHD